MNPHGHASVSVPPRSAWGTCDRCGFVYDLNRLKFQYEYRGASLINTNLRVCSTCMDKPFINNKPVRVAGDPMPVSGARPSMALIDATVELVGGVPTSVGGQTIPVDEIE